MTTPNPVQEISEESQCLANQGQYALQEAVQLTKTVRRLEQLQHHVNGMAQRILSLRTRWLRLR